MKIPKRLHQVWLGPRSRPAEWMDTWREENPTFDYRLWDEASLSAFDVTNRHVFERYMSERIYDGAADVARVEILDRLGGIYVDADSVAVRPLDHELLETGFFAVREPGSDAEEGLVGKACMGGIAGHPVLERYVDAISRVVGVRPMWQLTGPGVLTEILARSSEQDIEILPVMITCGLYTGIRRERDAPVLPGTPACAGK